jgi:hypothetical protein
MRRSTRSRAPSPSWRRTRRRLGGVGSKTVGYRRLRSPRRFGRRPPGRRGLQNRRLSALTQPTSFRASATFTPVPAHACPARGGAAGPVSSPTRTVRPRLGAHRTPLSRSTVRPRLPSGGSHQGQSADDGNRATGPAPTTATARPAPRGRRCNRATGPASTSAQSRSLCPRKCTGNRTTAPARIPPRM